MYDNHQKKYVIIKCKVIHLSNQYTTNYFNYHVDLLQLSNRYQIYVYVIIFHAQLIHIYCTLEFIQNW